jgi:hypothetical protein
MGVSKAAISSKLQVNKALYPKKACSLIYFVVIGKYTAFKNGEYNEGTSP